jgi:hypothetical protein
MSVLDLYEECRKTFPDITKKADVEHVQQWGELSKEFAYSWFENLANAINREMLNEIPAKEYKDLFEFMRSQFMFGEEKVKNCIDVAFTENLFWNVPKDKANDYWVLFPDILKDLYVNFHHRKPA